MSISSFLRNYSIFTADNEAPQIFHFWSAMSALSAIVSRRVSLSFDYFSIYPNLYVVLVGAPGTRKTTAMNISKEFVYTIGDIPFSAECQTKQSICQDMALNCQKSYTDEKGKVVSYTPYTIFSTELSHFLGHASAKEMVDFLTTIWDAKFYDTKTKNKGNDIIMGPYLSMIACTTPDWIRGWMREDVITGGFSRRALFVYFTGKTKRIPSPKITGEMEKARDYCIAWGQKLKEVNGVFKLTSSALKFYEEWYINLAIPQDITGGYYESKHIQMFKVAMLIALSESATELILDVHHLKLALAQLDLMEKNLLRVFQGIGRNELSAIAAKVLDYLAMNNGQMSELSLKLLLFRDASSNETFEVMRHLEETGRIARFKEQTSGQVMVVTKEVGDAIVAQQAASGSHPESVPDSAAASHPQSQPDESHQDVPPSATESPTASETESPSLDDPSP
jgi:Protein of unknown function (DUF3987)